MYSESNPPFGLLFLLPHQKLVQSLASAAIQPARRQCPTPQNLTLTLTLELADDGVQVSVLGSDMAPADWHLSVAALAESHSRPGSWCLPSVLGLSGFWLGWAPPPGRAVGPRPPSRVCPPESALPALTDPPPPTAQRASSRTRLAPGSCPHRGAEISQELAERRGPGPGQLL